jgi:Cellulase (glycosyl hydrolase family 5)
LCTVARVLIRPRLLTVLVALLAIVLVAPAAAEAKRKVPVGFFGAFYDPPSQLNQQAQFSLMARSGVEAVRLPANWAALQPAPSPPRFGALDSRVILAAQAGIQVMPVVIYSPRWASTNPTSQEYFTYAPRRNSDYASFLRALVARYGPNGTLWKAFPAVPKRPIREWQIWNEPSASYFWATKNYRRTYPRLLKAAYKAIHGVDRKATVVMAGLASFLQSSGRKSISWEDQRSFYRAGARRYFDAAAVHPFANSAKRVIRAVKEHRKVMSRFGDRRKPIYVTELAFLGSKGKIARKDYLGLEMSPAKQRKSLAAAYNQLARAKSLRVRRAFWFQWASSYSPTNCENFEPSFQFVGLVRFGCKSSNFEGTPLLSTYAKTARRWTR